MSQFPNSDNIAIINQSDIPEMNSQLSDKKQILVCRVRACPEIGKSNSRNGNVTERCCFDQMPWKCPGIYLGAYFLLSIHLFGKPKRAEDPLLTESTIPWFRELTGISYLSISKYYFILDFWFAGKDDKLAYKFCFGNSVLCIIAEFSVSAIFCLCPFFTESTKQITCNCPKHNTKFSRP